MTVKLGLFMMPLHDPARRYADILDEDRQAIILADRLGFSEVYVGEHISSWSERITSPLMFLASVIQQTRQIKFGTGVINLPQVHPATIAAQAAMFDQMSGGRLILGVGPGGLVSDMELFAVPAPELRSAMVQEAVDIILKLWSSDPPYDIRGRFWNISLKDNIWPEFKVGWVPRPAQQPHPLIALSLVTPNSASAKIAGERGWLPVSGNFFHRRYLRGHWEKYVEGCAAAGRQADPAIWRVARCILVTATDGEAESHLADPANGLAYYHSFVRHSFSEGRKALYLIKPDLEQPDDAVTVEAIKRSQVIAGSPRRVLDQLIALRDEIGHFGTLLMTGHDWDEPALWQRSMQLLAEQVMPQFSQHADAVPAAAD